MPNKNETDLIKKFFAESLGAKNTVYACPECGCIDIESESWVPMNGSIFVEGLGEVAVLGSSSEGSIYCQQCEDHVDTYCCEVVVSTGICTFHKKECVRPHPYVADCKHEKYVERDDKTVCAACGQPAKK